MRICGMPGCGSQASHCLRTELGNGETLYYCDACRATFPPYARDHIKLLVVPVRIVGVWAAGEYETPQKSEPHYAAIVEGLLVIPQPSGNEKWEMWKEYPRPEDKGRWHLHHVLPESEVAAMPD